MPCRGPRWASPARSLLVVALALVGCGGAEEPRQPDSAPLAVTLGSAGAAADKVRAGDLTAARAALEASLAADPDKLSALNDLGATYLLEGHRDAARRLLDEVVNQGNPVEQQAALLNLAELYALDGYLDAALAYVETAQGVDRGRPGPWYARALLLDVRGDLAGARAALRTAVHQDEGGAARAAFAYAYPEERTHLEALVAELSGDRALAGARWRELAQGRFAPLAEAAERHLAGQ
jgi:Tfp pilus assembly protein PilF